MKIVSVLFLLLFIVSCKNNTQESPYNEVVYNGGTYKYKGGVVEYKLKDGTRCAVFIGLKKGGISCDWK